MNKFAKLLALVLALTLCIPAASASATALSATPVCAPTTDGDVGALKILNLDVKYLAMGGNFTHVTTCDGLTHNAKNLAVVNLTNNKLVWAGNADGFVFAIEAINSVMYVGGAFEHVGNVVRHKTVGISTNDWSVTNWKPVITEASVTSLAYSSNMIYIGTSNSVRAVNQTNGLQTWRLVTTGGPVRTLLALHANNVLYVGGLFATLGGYDQHGAVAVSMTSGAVITSFKPVLRKNSYVGPSGGYDGQNPLSFAYDGTNNLILMGIASVGINEVFAVMVTTGALIPKSYHRIAGDGQAVAVIGDLYFAGYHKTGDIRPYASIYSATTGQEIAWDSGLAGPRVGSNADGLNGGIQCVAVNLSASTVYVGGAQRLPTPSLTAYLVV